MKGEKKLKHHFNPKTQKFGICRATIKECKFKTHCNSIEECNQFLEKLISGILNMVIQVKKTLIYFILIYIKSYY